MGLRYCAFGGDVLNPPAIAAASIATIVHRHVLIWRLDEVNDVTQERSVIVMQKRFPLNNGTPRCLLGDLGFQLGDVARDLVSVAVDRHIVLGEIIQFRFFSQHVDFVHAQFRIEMKEDLGRACRGQDGDIRMRAPVPELLKILIVEHREAVLVVLERIAAYHAQILQEVEGYQREATYNLQIAVYFLDRAQIVLEFLHDVLAAAYLYLEAARDARASAQLLRRRDAVHVRAGAFLLARALALSAGQIPAVILVTLHETGRTLDHAGAVERLIRIWLDDVQRFAWFWHTPALLFGDATPTHELEVAVRTMILATVGDHYVLADGAIVDRRSRASTQAGRMTTLSRLDIASVVPALLVAYCGDKSFRIFLNQGLHLITS